MLCVVISLRCIFLPLRDMRRAKNAGTAPYAADMEKIIARENGTVARERDNRGPYPPRPDVPDPRTTLSFRRCHIMVRTKPFYTAQM